MTKTSVPAAAPAPSGSGSPELLALTSFIMLVLTAVHYIQSVADVSSGREREFLAGVCLAAAAPYAWVLVLLGRGRRSEGAMAGIFCALLYLVGFGWIAAFLVLLSLSWQKVFTPALSLPVQLLGLVAAVALWRAQPKSERAAASRKLGLGVPIACVVVPLAAAFVPRLALERAPERYGAQASDAVRLVTELQECLVAYAARHGGGFPESLEALAADKPACSDALASVARARRLTKLAYRAAPPTPAGVRPAFALCAQPTEVPDNGFVTAVSDESGAIRKETAPVNARKPISCAAAWGSDLNSALRRLRFCLVEYAATAGPGYPKDLAELQRQLPECIGEARAPSELPTEIWIDSGRRTVGVVHYLSGDAVPGTPIGTYRLYLQCRHRVDKVVVGENGVIDDSSLAARWWRNDCRDPDPQIEPVPAFGDVPDLAARRVDCRDRAQDCLGLALELERAVSLARGNPYQFDSLDAAQKALIEEANQALALACEAGRARACTSLAWVLMRGRGVEDDPPRALHILQRSCAGGFAEACVEAAELLARGLAATRRIVSGVRLSPNSEPKPFITNVPDERRPGVDKDTMGAIAAFKSACALGSAEGCLRAPLLAIEAGNATGTQRESALTELGSLCEAGQGKACSFLARQGAERGGAVAGRGAAEWRRRACALGDRDACRG